MYPLSPRLASHPGCHTTLSRVPCTIQWVLVGYPFYLFIYLFLVIHFKCSSVHVSIPNSLPTPPPGNRKFVL